MNIQILLNELAAPCRLTLEVQVCAYAHIIVQKIAEWFRFYHGVYLIKRIHFYMLTILCCVHPKAGQNTCFWLFPPCFVDLRSFLVNVHPETKKIRKTLLEEVNNEFFWTVYQKLYIFIFTGWLPNTGWLPEGDIQFWLFGFILTK